MIKKEDYDRAIETIVDYHNEVGLKNVKFLHTHAGLESRCNLTQDHAIVDLSDINAAKNLIQVFWDKLTERSKEKWELEKMYNEQLILNSESNRTNRLIHFAEYLKRTRGFSKHTIPKKVGEYLEAIKKGQLS